MTNNNDKWAQETLEGNKLIAEFMGPTYTSTFTGKGRITLYCKYDSAHPHCEAHELEYHESWDWLMPVVEKINKLAHVGKLEGLDADIYRSMQDWILHVSIEPACGDIVTIIKWYNQQSTPTNKEQPEQTPAP